MTEKIDDTVAMMVRKFRLPKEFKLGSRLSPDASGAVADFIELLDARRRAAEQLNKSQAELVEKMLALARAAAVWLAMLMLLSFWMGWLAAGAA